MSDFEQLVQASRLYYELGETQNAIAEQLGVTRPQVSRLLKRARAEGIVEIRIVDRTTAESPAADELRRTYDLDAVHLAPTIRRRGMTNTVGCPNVELKRLSVASASAAASSSTLRTSIKRSTRPIRPN